MANKGLTQALKDDPALQLGVNVWEGQLTCKPVADSLALPYTLLDKVLR
jgi:alanine dehydrogenase